MGFNFQLSCSYGSRSKKFCIRQGYIAEKSKESESSLGTGERSSAHSLALKKDGQKPAILGIGYQK
jgi:hypothetical protein